MGETSNVFEGGVKQGRAKLDSESDESDPDFINNAPFTYERKRKVKSNLSKGRKRIRTTKRGKGPKEAEDTQHELSRSILTKIFDAVLPAPQCSSSESEHSEEYEIDSERESDRPSGALKEQKDRNPQTSRVKRERGRKTGEESETETESDPETDADAFAFAPTLASLQGNLVSEGELYDHHNEASGASDTESEDEFDAEDPFSLSPRPSFQRDLRNCTSALMLDEGLDIHVPVHINAYLREYQRDGIEFFYKLFKEGRGGVLGDDMGLGKTVQVIAFLAAIMRKRNDKRDTCRRRKHVSALQDKKEWRDSNQLPRADATWPTALIVAPSTVVHNWLREIETWGYFEVGLFTGPPDQRSEALKEFHMGRLDILVTSFDTARGDIDLLSDLPFSVIFVDEAHRIKNPASKVTQAFHRFTCQARFGLTGTAIQNAYEELFTLLDWTNPGRVGTAREWRTKISKPLTVGQSAKATETERATSKVVAHLLVNKILPEFFLRRTKDIIKDQLPKKFDEVVFCPLTNEQIAAYKNVLHYREERVKKIIPGKQPIPIPCDCNSGLSRTACCHAMDSAHFFTYLAVLLKISNHLALILPSPTDTQEQTKRNREVSRIAFGGRVPKYGEMTLQSRFCGKWETLNTLLRTWKQDASTKVLIFTKSVKLLDMLDFYLSDNGHTFCRLDGSVKQGERMPIIDRFNTDPDVYVFLISTLAGGTGLNLTSANKVVIFDPNWNPAHDLQAMDRAYRFGQRRDVHVYRLLGAGSIEEIIYARQVYKQQQMKIGYEASHQTRYFEGVAGDTKRRGELFGAENLFKLQEDTLTTKMAIERAHLAEFDWALANMKGSSKERRVLDHQLDTEDRSREYADLKGLADLLLDDDVPNMQRNGETNEIQAMLSNVKYTHQNDDLLRPSRVEEASLAESLKKLQRKREAQRRPGQKKSRRSSEVKSEEEEEEAWPPRRSHLTPFKKLQARQKALLELGIISTAGDLPAFAAKFGSMTADEQTEIIGRLDRHARL